MQDAHITRPQRLWKPTLDQWKIVTLEKYSGPGSETPCLRLCIFVCHCHSQMMANIKFEILEPYAFQKYNMHWTFEALYLCICLCPHLFLCLWQYNMSFFEVSKWWQTGRQTDRQTYFQIVDFIPEWKCPPFYSGKCWIDLARCPLSLKCF